LGKLGVDMIVKKIIPGVLFLTLLLAGEGKGPGKKKFKMN
jgi:hypothetical protein